VRLQGERDDEIAYLRFVTASLFTFRPLAASDLTMLHEWLNRPHVAAWWGSPGSLACVCEEYTGHIESPVVHPYIASLNGVPAAYIQAYHVMQADPAWWHDECDPGARGIDQFLADESQLGKGLGTRLVHQFVARLFDVPEVTKVQTDPSPDNARAIRAYEKAGFRRVGEVTTPDGPALLMVVHRAEFAVRS